MNYWVYENHIHRYASLHKATCSFCGNGHGIHDAGKTQSGNWLGPYSELADAVRTARDKKTDIRFCTSCLGENADSTYRSKTRIAMHAATPNSEPWGWDDGNELKCALRFNWVLQGRATLDALGKIKLPAASASPGLYRFKTRCSDGHTAIYIGESTDIQRRFGNYRNPSPSQLTNIRINAWLCELLSRGGGISVATVEVAYLNNESADLSLKSVRRMFEQAAIALESGEHLDSFNR